MVLLRKNLVIVVAAVAALLTTPSPAAASKEQCVRVGVFNDNDLLEIYSIILKEVYERAGLCHEQIVLPMKRSLQYLENGEIDSEIGRIFLVFPDPAKIVVVPTPLSVITGSVFGIKGKPLPDNIEDLRGKSIVALTGTTWVDTLTQVHDLDVLQTTSVRSAVNMILAKRADYMLIGSVRLAALKETANIDPEKISSKRLFELPIHIPLNANRKWLVPALNKAIKSLQSDGFVLKTFLAWQQNKTSGQLSSN